MLASKPSSEPKPGSADHEWSLEQRRSNQLRSEQQTLRSKLQPHDQPPKPGHRKPEQPEPQHSPEHPEHSQPCSGLE